MTERMSEQTVIETIATLSRANERLSLAVQELSGVVSSIKHTLAAAPTAANEEAKLSENVRDAITRYGSGTPAIIAQNRREALKMLADGASEERIIARLKRGGTPAAVAGDDL